MKSIKRLVPFVLAVVLLIVTLPAIHLPATAYTAYTYEEAVSWINAAAGQYWDWDGNGDTQCVELIKYYYSYLGVPVIRGNANTYATDPNKLPAGWTKIPYYSGFIAQPGDVAVFLGPSSYGHVALVSSADANRMYVVDQNHSDSVLWEAAVTDSYSYRSMGFYGVLRPDFERIQYSAITEGVYYLKSFGYDKYLSVEGGLDVNKQNVIVSPFSGDDSQKWEVIATGNGYKLRPLCSSARLLNPHSNNIQSADNVNLFYEDGSNTQWWHFFKRDHGYALHNAQNQSVVLHADASTNVMVYTAMGTLDQIWVLEPAVNYTISYHANGGSGAPSAQTKPHGQSIVLSTKEPVRSGYTFLGWSTSAGATTASYSVGANFSIDKNTTLYAVWKKNVCTHGQTEVRNAKTPTCSAAGYSGDTYCKSCGKLIKSGSVIAKRNHSYQNAVQKATCTQNGLKKATCSSCGHTISEPILAAGHRFGDWVYAQKATCTKAGIQKRVCSVCGEAETKTVKATGHNFGQLKVIVEATVTSEGLREGKCKNCDQTIKEVIPCTVVDKETGTSIYAGEGTFEAGTEVKVEVVEKESQRYAEIAGKMSDICDEFVVYDLSVYSNGQKVDLESVVEAEFLLPKQYGMDGELYWVTPSGVPEKLEISISEDGAALSADIQETGIYVVAKSREAQPVVSPEEPSSEPSDTTPTDEQQGGTNGENNLLGMAIIVACAAVVVAVVALLLVIIKLKKKK